MADTPDPPVPYQDGETQLDRLHQQIGEIRTLPTGHRYHDGEQYISFLNYSLTEKGWSYRILEHGRDEDADEMWALVELTAMLWEYDPHEQALVKHLVVKQDFGAQQIERVRATGLPRSIGDNRKAAVTDGLKRCARQLGVALYLWAKDGDAADRPYRRSDADEEWRAGLGRPNRPANGAPGRPRMSPGGPSNAPAGPGAAPAQPAQPATSGPARERLEQQYEDQLADATAQGFRAGWTATPVRQLTDIQIEKYGAMLGRFLNESHAARGAA